MRLSKLRLIGFVALLSSVPLSAYAGPGRSPADYDVLRGTAVVKVFGEHAVVVGVLDDKAKNEGNIDLFRLETEGTLQPLNAVLKNASVEYRGSELVVIDASSQTFYTFSTNEAKFTAPRPPGGFNGVHYTGYSLNHTIRPLDQAPKGKNGRQVRPLGDPCEWTLCFFEQDPYYNDGGSTGGGSNCSSGGRGATSCSVTNNGSSCSVSCSSGYYACCSQGGPNCYCYPN
jgi:hypothetical protein